MVSTILFYLFIGIVLIQLSYYGLVFSKFAFAKPAKSKKKNIPVSVVVCARNEEANLKVLIPLLLEQDYPEFELLLINDASTDDSLQIMKDFEQQHENIKVVDVAANDAFLSSKKYALTLGIKASKYDFLLFTDADCRPISPQWIKTMSSHFTNSKSIIIGYGAYNKIKGKFLNKLIRFETVLTAMQYFSFAKLGMPYMAVGRNLAYRKDVFFSTNGFTSHMQIQSGDDDLFIKEAANAKNTALSYTNNSFTISQPKTRLKDWFNQKRRHIQTANYYTSHFKFLLGLFYTSQLTFWIVLIILLVLQINIYVVIGLALIRIFVFYLVLGFSTKKLNESDLLPFLPVLEVFLISLQLVIFISNLAIKSNRWS